MRCASLFVYLWFFCHVASKFETDLRNDDETEYILRILITTKKLVTFSNVVVLFGDQQLNDRSEINNIFHERIMKTLNSTLVVGDAEIGTLNMYKYKLMIVLVFFDDLDDPNIRELSNILSGTIKKIIIFIYRPKRQIPLNALEKYIFFSWCYKSEFTRVALIQNQVNTYECYSYYYINKLKISKLTETFFNNRVPSNIDPYAKSLNFQWLVTVYDSMPAAYLYNSTQQTDVINGNISLGGVNGYLMVTFMRHVKGKMDILSFANRSDLIMNAARLAGGRFIDAGVNLIWNQSMAEYSYTIKSTKDCIVVPSADRLPFEEYTMHALKVSIHLFTIFIFLAHCVIKRLTYPRMSLWAILYSSLRITCMQGLSHRELRDMRSSDKILHFFTTIYNLLITSIVCTAFITAFTLGYYKPEIEDEQALIQSRLPIMISDHEHIRIVKENELPRDLEDQLLFVNQKIQEKHFFGLNRSYAYIASSENMVQLNYIQQKLNRPKLQIASPKLCTVDRNLRLEMRSDMHFTYVLNSFVRRTQETGFFKKWMKMTLAHAQQTGLITQVPPELSEKLPLPLSYFKNIFIAISLNMAISFIVFVLECICATWNKRSFSNNHGGGRNSIA